MIAIYGAIARTAIRPSESEVARRAIKRRIFELRDQLLWCCGSPRYIDYRNYDSLFATNIGDLAISEATRSLFSKQLDSSSYLDLSWGQLGQISIHSQTLGLVVFAGGGYLLLNRDGALPARINADIASLAGANLPAVLFGIGVNFPGESRFDADTAALSTTDEDTVRRLLDRVALISVRDALSQQFLARFTQKKIHLIGDPALFFLSTKQAPLRADNCAQPLVGVNFSFHGPTSNEILKRNISAYVRLLKALMKESNCRFRYFVHNDSEHLIPRLLAAKGIKIEVVSGTPTQVAESYRDLDLHIGGMLHSCILAHSAGIPTLGLAYDIKHHGFFSLMGLAQNCFSAIDFAEVNVFERARELLVHPASTRAAIIARKDELEKCTNEFVASCLELCSANIAIQRDHNN